jgi:hypothetical protein
MATMKRRVSFLALLVLLAAVGAAGAGPCTPISSLPAIITTQGVYCFTQHLATSITTGNAIDVQVNNVTIDLNGFTLDGIGAGLATQTSGIYANKRQNVTVINGTIRGFLMAVFFEDLGEGHVVERIRAERNTFTAIEAQGNGLVIRNNQVVATGGTTAFGPIATIGIHVAGIGPRVLNNDVAQTVGVGGAAGVAIQLDDTSDGLVVNNRLTDADQGVTYVGSGGKYQDNLTFGVTTPFTGGTPVGTKNN